MSRELVAIHCPTKELWDKVNKDTKSNLTVEWKYGHCINPNMQCWERRSYYEDNNYTIIEAENYLKWGSAKPKTKENKMNETIRKVFKDDTLELAEKMDEHFGCDFNGTFTDELIIRYFKEKYVAEINRLEEEAKKEEGK